MMDTRISTIAHEPLRPLPCRRRLNIPDNQFMCRLSSVRSSAYDSHHSMLTEVLSSDAG